MIDLGNFRIIQMDRYNLTFEQIKDVENKSTKEKTRKWVKVGGYYGNLQQCIKALKDYLIAERLQIVENGCENPETIIEYLDRLNNSYVNCNLNLNINGGSDNEL